MYEITNTNLDRGIKIVFCSVHFEPCVFSKVGDCSLQCACFHIHCTNSVRVLVHVLED